MTSANFEMASLFDREWSDFRPGHQPAGWMLRDAGSLPWVRFHSLPQSKRYPDNEAEAEIILSRAEALGDAILGRGAACWQVECRYKELAQPRTPFGRQVRSRRHLQMTMAMCGKSMFRKPCGSRRG